MEIVVEYVLIDNIVINFLILYLSALVLRLEKRKLRLFIAACFGAIFSLITPLLSLPTWLMIAYKVLLGLVIARLGLKTNGFKKNALAFSVFSKIFDVPFEKIITKKIDENEIENSHYITYGTATGQSKMLVCEVENFCVSLEQGNTKEFQDVAVGLSLVKFQKCYDCRALMGAEFAKEFV